MVEKIELEFRGAPLGDQRRSQRLEDLGIALARDPALSFPEAMETEARLESLYRFVNNEAISAASVLAPHQAQTSARCQKHKTVLVLHDTTSMQFSAEREGLGRIQKLERRGFFLHASLAITPEREPLGLVRAEMWARTEPPHVKVDGKRANPRIMRRNPNREFLRWGRAVRDSDEFLEGTAVIHIMDREGDSFDLFANLQQDNRRFVIRLTHDRNLEQDPRKLRSVMALEPIVFTRQVLVSSRKPHTLATRREIHPPRDEGVVQLGVSARSVTLLRPATYASGSPKSLTVNVVVVKQQGNLIGSKPIEWNLVTTEPIDSREQLEAIVDAYRARWVIEEFFKALKTGCQFEKRQLESFSALKIALAIFVPIAVNLLALRTAARVLPDEPCTALPRTQLAVLRAFKKMSLCPTNREAYLALASLGGHLKRNGDPGWIVLARAYEKLLVLEQGWKAAKRNRKSDQS